MLKIFFESDKEVIRFCEQIFRYYKEFELNWKTDEEWGNQIQLEEMMPKKEFLEVISTSMVDVFLTFRLGKKIDDIIGKYYYYTDPIEKERIQELTQWIFAGEDEDSLKIRKNKDPSQFLQTLFISHIKNADIVHFDSIVKFSLNPFRDQLIHYVGLAIDEFKREEDHQEFVNMLRNYIAKKESTVPLIHILQRDPFLFFNEHGRKISNKELRERMQREALYIFGLDENELNLAPLIAMAPEKIKIYGNDPSEPKTMTVINIFQEKVIFEHDRHFPFPYKKMSNQK
ncbi:putative sporulation protein YtxC [Virgibacillus oceani]